MFKTTPYLCRVYCPIDCRIYPMEIRRILIEDKEFFISNGCDFLRQVEIDICGECCLKCQNIVQDAIKTGTFIPNPIDVGFRYIKS